MLIVDVAIADEAWTDGTDWEALAAQAVKAALAENELEPGSEISVLLTNDQQVQDLNAAHRDKDKPTNVLSFEGDGLLLGDIVLARGVLEREAVEQGKSLINHATHLIVHGALHLVGLDHLDDKEADQMEARETTVLAGLGISDPYL
jgi:probable rRNA maturation factor